MGSIRRARARPRPWATPSSTSGRELSAQEERRTGSASATHALVSFTDPFTLKAWAGIEVEGLPDLGEQVRMVGEQVIPEVRSD